MSRTKASYMVSDGLGPHFHKALRDDICTTDAGFTIQFDDTTNAKVKKQYDLLIRYWSESDEKVCVRFWKALMYGHSPGVVVAEGILATCDEPGCMLPAMRLLNIGSDGPNVNKTTYNVLNTNLQKRGHPGLLKFMPCNIHVAHNAFRHGLDVYGDSAEQLCVDLFYWFKLSSCRREDFSAVQIDLGLDEHLLMKHVQCRWLTLLASLTTIMEQWEALIQYFTKNVPRVKGSKAVMCTDRYKRIVRNLTPAMKIQINFLLSLHPIFDKFLLFFQMEGPLIHLLHEEMETLVKSLMLRFLPSGVVSQPRMKLQDINLHHVGAQLSDKEIEIDELTRKAMTKESDRNDLKSMRSFYITTVEYLLSHFPLENSVLINAKCLHPLARKEGATLIAVRKLALQITQIISGEEVVRVTDEWKIYQNIEIDDSCYIKERKGNKIVFHRIDYYWNLVMKLQSPVGELRFPTLPKLVKSILCLPHGNADVERGFSENKSLLTPERASLGPEAINGLRTVKDGIKKFGDAASVPITREMKYARNHSHEVYTARLNEQRLLKEREKRAKEEERVTKRLQQEANEKLRDGATTLLNSDELLQKNEKEQRLKLRDATDLFYEANEKLKLAISSKDLKKVVSAQALIEIANRKVQEARKKLVETSLLKKKSDAKKRKLLEDSLICTLKKISKRK